MEVCLDEIAKKAYPGWSPKTANFAIFGVQTPRGDPVARGRRGICGNQIA